MRILIAVASRHEATREVGERIGAVLAAELPGAEVDVRDPAEVHTVDPYDAVVLGSAVYMGRWLPAARELLDRAAADLERRPLWLFSSGPIDGGPPAAGPAANATTGALAEGGPLRHAAGAREHRVFTGRLERSRLTRWEKAVVGALRVPDSDGRDWGEVAAWAREIAMAVAAESGR